jgi:cytochrome c2
MKLPLLRLSQSLILLLATGTAGLTAAEPAEKGFRFPGGDADAGRDAFVKLNCVQCHSVAKTDLAAPKTARKLHLTLAEKVLFVKKYEDLITAITNPKHVVANRYRQYLTHPEQQGEIEPIMPNLTKDMTVRQLMDIVTFLDESFRKAQPEYGK